MFSKLGARSKQEGELTLLLASYSFLQDIDPVDGGSTFLRNVGELLQDYTASYPSVKGPIHDQSCCATLRVVQHD
jgi:hypothetical protein